MSIETMSVIATMIGLAMILAFAVGIALGMGISDRQWKIADAKEESKPEPGNWNIKKERTWK